MDIISRDEARAKDLKRFFTGEVCIHGHRAERYVLSGTCAACHGIVSLPAWQYEIHPIPDRPRFHHGRPQRTTDFSRLTEAQIEAWYKWVDDLRNGKHRMKRKPPLDDEAPLWRPRAAMAL